MIHGYMYVGSLPHLGEGGGGGEGGREGGSEQVSE